MNFLIQKFCYGKCNAFLLRKRFDNAGFLIVLDSLKENGRKVPGVFNDPRKV